MKLKQDIKLVECTEEYWEFVRLLRLDERVIGSFVDTTHISEEQQINYMTRYHPCFRIALVDGIPAGYVGVIDNDIRVCTHPSFQRMGVGKFMIHECVKLWPDAFAKIKLENEQSIKLFEACGFTKKFFILTKE